MSQPNKSRHSKRTVACLEAVGKLSDPCVDPFLRLSIWRGSPKSQAQDHHGSRDRTTGSGHSPHAAAKARGDFEGGLFVNPFGVGGKHGLGTVEALGKAGQGKVRCGSSYFFLMAR